MHLDYDKQNTLTTLICVPKIFFRLLHEKIILISNIKFHTLNILHCTVERMDELADRCSLCTVLGQAMDLN